MKTSVSCVCAYHGRNWVLREAVESFRRQELPDGVTAELIILNDMPEQDVVCRVPGVRVINRETTSLDLSKKTNELVEFSDGEWICWWDDDDISLPHRLKLSLSIAQIHGAMAVRWDRAWYCPGEIISRPRNLFMGGAIIRRDHYLRIGGCVPGQWNDQSLQKALLKHEGYVEVFQDRPEETHFIYRWGGTGTHISGITRDCTEALHRMFSSSVKSDTRFRPGVVEIEPYWKRDWVELVADAISAGKGDIL